jgi:hypothetical protein
MSKSLRLRLWMPLLLAGAMTAAFSVPAFAHCRFNGHNGHHHINGCNGFNGFSGHRHVRHHHFNGFNGHGFVHWHRVREPVFLGFRTRLVPHVHRGFNGFNGCRLNGFGFNGF